MPPAADRGPVTVRRATQDAAFLAELGARTFVDGYRDLMDPGPLEAFAASRPVAMERLYVDRLAQGGGVGRILFAWVLAKAVQIRADAIWLGVWERNARAIAIYERWGFTAIGAVPFRFGAETHRDLLMVLPLDESGGPA